MSGDDAPDAFDRPQVFLSGLSDLPLHETVPDPAPQGPGARQVAPVLVSRDLFLELLPACVHGSGMDEPDPS